MKDLPELYFTTATEWRAWLDQHYDNAKGVYLIFCKVDSGIPSMRWEEAVRVALCYGWIDSTVKKIDEHRRRQYFCPRKPKSVWSKVNKQHIQELTSLGLMHPSGLQAIEIAQANGSWVALDDVENGVIPKDLQLAFDQNPIAFTNFQNFAPGYRKSYLYWLHQAKRTPTRKKRILEIINYCEANQKSRS